MTEPPPPPANVDAILDRLEQAIARLADGSAPLDRLVSAYEEAKSLAEQARAELERVQERLGGESAP